MVSGSRTLSRCLLNRSLGKSTFEKDKTHEGSRLTRTWQSREAQKTSKWSRKRWWYADWKDEYGEIVSKPVGQEGLSGASTQCAMRLTHCLALQAVLIFLIILRVVIPDTTEREEFVTSTSIRTDSSILLSTSTKSGHSSLKTPAKILTPRKLL